MLMHDYKKEIEMRENRRMGVISLLLLLVVLLACITLLVMAIRLAGDMDRVVSGIICIACFAGMTGLMLAIIKVMSDDNN